MATSPTKHDLAQLAEVQGAVRKDFFEELEAAGVDMDWPDDFATVTLNSVADCESLSSLVPVLPSQGRRFKRATARPDSTSVLYVFAVPGREVAALTSHLAVSAGFQ